jgi:hypothetical protein
MTQGKQPNLHLANIRRVNQTLKHQISLVRTVTTSAKRRQSQGMGSVISQVETAREGQ